MSVEYLFSRAIFFMIKNRINKIIIITSLITFDFVYFKFDLQTLEWDMELFKNYLIQEISSLPDLRSW